MTYIPFISQDDLVLDNQQRKIPGAKIEVLDPISNNPVDIFVYDGSNDTYTITTNPIYLDVYSRPEHTYFAKQLVLCRLYKYRGNFSDPMIDDDTNNWEFVREWNGCFHENEAKNDTIIYGFLSLKDANTDLGSVTVVGYWNQYDCEARTYIWDGTCVQTPDNGYIVKSNNKDTGRWILKFDGEYLPSTYYGVYPGHTSNINALLSYVDTVGTNATKTAPGVYFARGTYNHGTSLSTSKKILLDADTQFPALGFYFTVSDVKVVGTPTHYICDFLIHPYEYVGSACVAHSSWFRTIDKFLDCGAETLIWDRTDFFTNKQITGTHNLYKQDLQIYKAWDYTYASNAIVNINACNIEANQVFRFTNDYISFYDVKFNLDWFVVPSSQYQDASYDFGSVPTHHIGMNNYSSLKMSDFPKNEYGSFVYRRIRECYNQTSIDFENYPVYGFYNTKFTKISNAKITDGNYGYITNSLRMLEVDGITASEGQTWGGAKLYNEYFEPSQGTNPARYVISNSKLTFVNYVNDTHTSRPLQEIEYILIKDSEVTFTKDIDTVETQFIAYDSTIKGEINFVSKGYYNYDKGKKTELFNVSLDTNPASANNHFCNEFVAKSCDIFVPLKHYPYLENGNYYFNTEYIENRFWTNAKIVYTQNEGSYNNTSNAIENVIPRIFFDSNCFNQSDLYGIYMPLYTVNNYGSGSKYLIAQNPLSVTGYHCYYHNNTGNCPSEWLTDNTYNGNGNFGIDPTFGVTQIYKQPQTRCWRLYGDDWWTLRYGNANYGACGNYVGQRPDHEDRVVTRGFLEIENAYGMDGGYGTSTVIQYRNDACYPDPTYGDAFDNRYAIANNAGDGFFEDNKWYCMLPGPNMTKYKPTPYMKR